MNSFNLNWGRTVSKKNNQTAFVINVLEIRYDYSSIYLCTSGIVAVDWNGWQKIDEVEVSRGKACNKPREKIVDINEMLDIGGMPA